MTWIVVAIEQKQSDLAKPVQLIRFYFGPFDSEDKANQFAEQSKAHCFCAFSVRLEKPIME